MRKVSIMPAAFADQIPLPDEALVRKNLSEARGLFHRKIVVLDDDPTGIQTVHDLPVYTDWQRQTLEEALVEDGPMFFILTNSRSFTEDETIRAHREIAARLSDVSRKTGVSFLLVSRGDSTLRGHYPLETEVLRKTLEQEGSLRFDGEIIMPYFKEGGRLTIGNIHYVKSGDRLIPAGMTEFSKDATFAYSASDLTEWCEERTGGRYPAAEVITISLEELRGLDYEGMLGKLLSAEGFQKIVVNAADDRDTEVFAAVLFRAIAMGKEFLFRCAAGLVRVLGGVSLRPPLSKKELQPGESEAGGLIIVGSHVKKTTEQLECLLSAGFGLYPVCFQAETALEDGGLERESARVLRETEQAIRGGKTALVYTSRQVLRARKEHAQENLNLSVRISKALTSVVRDLSVRPAFLIAKGGITSSDVGVRALGVRRAWVLGQAAPGIPVWRTGAESKFPGLSYVIFPGNVGEVTTLRDVVKTFLS